MTDAQVLDLLGDRKHSAVRATAFHMADQGARLHLIRQRMLLVASLVAQAKFTGEMAIDLREHSRTGRRNAYRIAADLAGVRTAKGEPHFEVLGLCVCIARTAHCNRESFKQLQAEARRDDASRARKQRYERSDKGIATRKAWRLRIAEDRDLLREWTEARVKAFAPTPRPRGGTRFAPQSGVTSLHTPPSQIGRESNITRQKSVTTLSYGYSAEADHPHTPSKSTKKTNNLNTPPTAPDRARMPDPCTSPELGTQPFPQCELGSEVSLSTRDSFAEAFPDYHERMDSEADDTMAAYAEWASLKSNEPARPDSHDNAPRPADHAVPVGTCGGGLENVCFKTDGPAARPPDQQPATASPSPARDQRTEAEHDPADEGAREDWLSDKEVTQLPPDSQELWAAYKARSYPARLRIVATLRRNHLGGPSSTSHSPARPPLSKAEQEREQIKRGEQILLRQFGLRKEDCVDPSTMAPAADDAPMPLVNKAMEAEEKLDHLMVEIGTERAYLRWSVLDRNNIPSYLVGRAAYYLRRKLQKRQRVQSLEAWLFSNAKQYAERGTLPSDVIAEPRPFEDAREAAETLAPKYALYHEGPGARRWF